MHDSFRDLGIGLLFASVFVYLLMVVNYQNFGDPLVVILALPATLCGILTMLFITGTTLSVPSLMGAIMAVGVASANSILLVTFAREQQLKGRSAFRAALDAGRTRIRPVLMTAAAMVVGMIPMAIGAPGEEQNAALARAVIGGLSVCDPNHPPSSSLISSPCCASATATASRPTTAYSRSFPMNDLGAPNWNNAIHLKRQGRPAVGTRDRELAEAPPASPVGWASGFAGSALDARRRLLDLTRGGNHAQHEQVMATAKQETDFVPSLRVATMSPSPGTMSVTLPGTTAAFTDANIYARATGYIAKRNVDIGDHVKTGELLAELSVPELDDQISQNEATLEQLKSALEQVQANLKLAQVTWDRDRPLVQQGWATQQQGTVDIQTVKADEAAVAAVQNNVTA